MQLTEQEEKRLAMLGALRKEVVSSKDSEWSLDGQTFLHTDDFLICLAFEEGAILRAASERVGSC